MAGRNSALRGAYIDLTAVFQDAAQQPVDPTNLRVSVFPPGFNPEDGAEDTDAWVYDVTLSSGGSGPEAVSDRVVEKIATGTYKFTFFVPDDAVLGAAYDRWEGTVDSEDLDETFTFTLVGGGSVGTSQLYENNVVFLTLSTAIASTDGSTLGEEYSAYFTTTYNPLYASPRQVRLDLGPYVSDLPDDTLNFALYEAGKDADANCFQSTIADATFLAHAKHEYTLAMAKLILVRALTGDINLAGRMSKTLGSLSVSRGGGTVNLHRMAEGLQETVQQWRTALRTGGDVSPGAGLRPESSIKGALAEDQMVVGRQWEPTSGVGFPGSRSAANAYKYESGRRDIRTFKRRNSTSDNQDYE
jgi:hypothetical protein